MDVISLVDARVLREVGALKSATICGEGNVFRLLFHVGQEAVLLVGQRGKPREFKEFRTVIKILRELSIHQGNFNIEKYEISAPKTLQALANIKDTNADALLNAYSGTGGK